MNDCSIYRALKTKWSWRLIFPILSGWRGFEIHFELLIIPMRNTLKGSWSSFSEWILSSSLRILKISSLIFLPFSSQALERWFCNYKKIKESSIVRAILLCYLPGIEITIWKIFIEVLRNIKSSVLGLLCCLAFFQMLNENWYWFWSRTKKRLMTNWTFSTTILIIFLQKSFAEWSLKVVGSPISQSSSFF